jgi:hypothetical protein
MQRTGSCAIYIYIPNNKGAKVSAVRSVSSGLIRFRPSLYTSSYTWTTSLFVRTSSTRKVCLASHERKRLRSGYMLPSVHDSNSRPLVCHIYTSSPRSSYLRLSTISTTDIDGSSLIGRSSRVTAAGGGPGN